MELARPWRTRPGVAHAGGANRYAAAPWHFLYFFSLPQGHGSLRPTFGSLRRIVSTTGW